jgi:serine/threonine-protein kinase
MQPLGNQPTLDIATASLTAGPEPVTQPASRSTAPVGEAPLATFGDYEILGEIARGGMGIVFRARQKRLHRIVALKMILAGHLAGETELKRFQSEAQAAAQLNHPGIVPIYEVGEEEGRHFFSMSLIEGESLQTRLKQGPLPPREAAQIVRSIAEAVEYAHRRGIVHRDLKPQNILLDLDGAPKITDFGLAKRIDRDDGLTTTGNILGTPGYMAPEQAEGRLHDVGPLSDVYSLGAILYATLTARPPFHAASALETLQQVIEEPPPPPQVVNPSVPTDLQSICLQCLEKDSARRYPSADALAKDLSRWLDGESILATGYSWKAALIRTLQRSRDDVKLRSWGSMLLAFAPIVGLAEVGIYAHARGGPPYPYHLALIIRGVQFLAMMGVFVAFRRAWQGTAAAAAEQMWSLWLAYLVGCNLIALSVFQLQPLIGPGQPVQVMAAYPYFAVLSGMLFIALGRGFWGFCYAFGLLFFALAILFPYCLLEAPLLFGGVWTLLLTLLGWRLRRLPDHREWST